MRSDGSFACAAALRLSAACLLLIALAGCQTTGDPRSGGLFGWSEGKAKERQTDLERNREQASRVAAEETQRGAELTEKKSQLRSEVQTLQTQLANLLTENQSLEDEVKALLTKRQLGAVELSRLQQSLEASKRARMEAQRVSSQAPAPRQTERLSQQTDVVRQYNQQLHREVMLLMGR